ncbi:hypothetical protein [Agromyces sp. SYSU T00194]|uniref:hypothetical protein n=1 Tax=Agromyces chitinivorans TaxID=3158560 RepID=UPI0033967F87
MDNSCSPDEVEVEPTTPSLSRRGVVTSAAWAIPAVAVAVTAPAFAASEPLPSGQVVAACGSGNTASFAAQLSSAPVGATVTMLFTRTGDGGLSTTSPAGWVLGTFTANTRSYTTTVQADGTADGTFGASVTGIVESGSATVTAQLSLSSGPIMGKTIAEVEKSFQNFAWSCSVLQ